MIKIVTGDFNPWQELQDYQQTMVKMHGKFGATAVFVGTMRDFNQGDQVQAMSLEYYPRMTEKQLSLIVDQAKQQWSLLETLLIHKVGEILPAEPIVLVAVWSIHRSAAFEACRFIMDMVKSKAPFWKKEQLTPDSHRWVSQNTP
jgi:molybdopterin synthase catalytic subunit